MERQAKFLRSLFILLVAIYVAYACSCRRVSLEELLCPERNRTVLMATVGGNVTYLDWYGNVTTDQNAGNARYEMNLTQSFKNGTNPLDIDNGGFSMNFPRVESVCGREFNISDSYLFTGRVNSNGDFHSDSCENVIPKADVVNNSTLMNILNGNHTLNCTHF